MENLTLTIEDEGLDYAMADYSDWEEFLGTDLGRPLTDYINARENLINKVKELSSSILKKEIDV